MASETYILLGATPHTPGDTSGRRAGLCLLRGGGFALSHAHSRGLCAERLNVPVKEQKTARSSQVTREERPEGPPPGTPDMHFFFT